MKKKLVIIAIIFSFLFVSFSFFGCEALDGFLSCSPASTVCDCGLQTCDDCFVPPCDCGLQACDDCFVPPCDCGLQACDDCGDADFYGGLRVHFLDVGQADAALIILPDSTKILVDAGRHNITNRSFQEELQGFFPAGQRMEFEWFITTHCHADHIGSAAWVVENSYIRNIVRPVAFSNAEIAAGVYRQFGIEAGTARNQTTATMRNFAEAMEESFWIDSSPTNIYIPFAGKQFTVSYTYPKISERCIVGECLAVCVSHCVNYSLEGSAVFTFYSPTRTNYGGPFRPNVYSTIFCLYFNGRRIMFTGDAYIENEERVSVLYALPTNIDVLDVGHHGSNTSTGNRFLDRIMPSYAIIQVGTPARGNSHGHPHNAALGRLETRGINIFRTDMHGAIDVLICRTGENLFVGAAS